MTGSVPDFQSNPSDIAFFLFQIMFCSTATTITSGAVAERMKFRDYLAVVILSSGLIYPVFGHWAWNGTESGTLTGWLGQLGFVDFAGSTVVHSVGGWISLATLMIIGPRNGRFSDTGRARKLQTSNLPLSVLGTMLLWFGWLGFNGGSTFAFNTTVAKILLNTVLGGAAGMLLATALVWHQHKRVEAEALINGSLAGLVAITASCNVVPLFLAIVIGAIGGAIMLLTSDLLEHWHIDDAVGAVPIHLGAGMWGTLAVALFDQADLIPD